MTSHRFTGALAVVIAASVLVSCGDDSPLDVGGTQHGADRRDRAAARPEPGKARAGKDTRRVGERRRARASEGSASGRDAGRSPARPDDGGAGAAVVAGGSDVPASQPATACSPDMAGDVTGSGSAPAYTDLTRGCVREAGSQLRLEATTAGSLPARMPDRNTILSIGFDLDPASGRSTYVVAEAAADGWRAYLTHGGDRRQLPAPTVDGNQVRLDLPAAAVGAERLDWRVESSWTKSTLVSTAYAFDDAPNGGTATLDRG